MFSYLLVTFLYVLWIVTLEFLILMFMFHNLKLVLRHKQTVLNFPTPSCDFFVCSGPFCIDVNAHLLSQFFFFYIIHISFSNFSFNFSTWVPSVTFYTVKKIRNLQPLNKKKLKEIKYLSPEIVSLFPFKSNIRCMMDLNLIIFQTVLPLLNPACLVTQGFFITGKMVKQAVVFPFVQKLENLKQPECISKAIPKISPTPINSQS